MNKTPSLQSKIFWGLDLDSVEDLCVKYGLSIDYDFFEEVVIYDCEIKKLIYKGDYNLNNDIFKEEYLYNIIISYIREKKLNKLLDE